MKKPIALVFLLMVIGGTYAQHINSYKYIIVPKKFAVLKKVNQYQLNTLTKFLFKESGFTVVYDDELPDDLQQNICMGLQAELLEDSGMFSTKLNIVLRDCKNQILFTSSQGKSREKEFKKGYQEALRNAFESVAALNYNYTPLSITTSTAEKTKQLQPPTEPEEQPTPHAIPPPYTVQQTILYAQAITNGFQLVNSIPEVVYIIQRTGMKEVYILKDKNGILYQKGTDWIAEYYQEDQRVQEVVNIKF